MRHFRHYYYPRRRTAYGPRQGHAHVYVGEAVSLSARELAALPQVVATLGLRFVARTMPRGGARLLVACPDCRQWCARLYATAALAAAATGFRWPSPWPWACRACAGLVYWRQYAGRRPEADLTRIWVLIGRYRGWHEALATWCEREALHDVRAKLALTINQLRLEQMIAYHKQLDELNAVARESVAAYRQTYREAKRQSVHTATITRLSAEIRRLRSKRLRVKQRRRRAEVRAA